MKCFRLLTGLLLLLLQPLHILCLSDNLTNAVTWDSNSLLVNGSRVWILSAEFHYQRLPNPALWRDVFDKFRAEGYNTLSIYFFWYYHSAAKGVYDFETSGKNLQLLLDTAKQAGLYVIARPGPYCNAETNGGGFALYLGDGSGGKLRTSDATYYQSWLPWILNVNAILARNEITKGGPVILSQIENELQETTHSATNTLVLYMEQAEAAYRAAGVTVPFTSNEKGERSESWSRDYQDVGGSVDVYGLDSYPGGLSCTNPNSGFTVVTNYYQWFQNYSYSSPVFFPEFESGYISNWGSTFSDYCSSELSYNFADVYYKNNIGQKTTMLSHYMAYGGTNWGHSAAPVVYTSYDYAAPLRETRQIRDKLYQIKLIGLMTRVSQDLLVTNMINNGSGYAVNDTAVWTWHLRNPNTGANFYTILHTTSSSRASTTVTLSANTSQGVYSIPGINLAGRQSKIIVTDYQFGNHTLLFSSAEVLTYGVYPTNDVMVFYLEVGQVGHFALRNSPQDLSFKAYGVATNLAAIGSTSLARSANFTYTQGGGITAVQFSSGALIYLLDRVTAYTFHAPPTTLNPNVLPSEHLFVMGPYLVRNASLSGSVVNVYGDVNVTTPIEVYTGNAATSSIVWNGQALTTTKTAYGSLTATIVGPESRNIVIPTLSNWKTADSFPEVQPSYDDSLWTVCNKTTTLSPVKPLTLPVLFSSDYGFHQGIKIYRGHFPGTTATAGNITAQNGFAAGWNAWINGYLVTNITGSPALTSTNAVFTIPQSILVAGDNVLTVLVDYTGHDETSTGSGVENPRGLLGVTLTGANFTSWRIQGNAGGSAANIDPVRGPVNEGGLYGERRGWHLPGFDTSTWAAGSPMTGVAKSGVQWYTTNFNLNIDADLDVPIGVSLSSPAGTNVRVQLFVNGYQYGKYVPLIGPQTVFPLQPGVLNTRGANTLSLSVWAQTDAGATLDSVQLVTYGGVYQSGFNFNQDWSYLQPAWTTSRLAYT